jgi:hypothetical protein
MSETGPAKHHWVTFELRYLRDSDLRRDELTRHMSRTARSTEPAVVPLKPLSFSSFAPFFNYDFPHSSFDYTCWSNDYVLLVPGPDPGLRLPPCDRRDVDAVRLVVLRHEPQVARSFNATKFLFRRGLPN